MTDTLRDRLAAVLGHSNAHESAYSQADVCIDVINQWDAERSEAGDTPWDDAVARFRASHSIASHLGLSRLSSRELDELRVTAQLILVDRFESGAFE